MSKRVSEMIARAILLSLVFLAVVSQREAFTISDPPKRPLNTPGWYGGTVKAVGKDWVELAAGWKSSRIVDSDGAELSDEFDNSKVKRISAGGTTSGGNKNGDGNRETYRTSDLKSATRSKS